MRMRELRGSGGVEECEVYYTRGGGEASDGEKSGKSGARDAKKGRELFGLRDTSQGLTQPLLDPPTGQLFPSPPPLPPFVSGSFSVAATPSGPAVTLASTTISTERGRRYSVSVLVEPPDTDTTINGDADGVSGFHRIFRLSAVFLLLS